MALLIKNGQVINADKSFYADVLLRNGKIVRIASSIHSDQDTVTEEINAAGMFLFPGGIDPHVHMHLPTAAGYSSDDFFTGSRAALFGGTTTLIDFVTPHKGQSLCEALAERKKEAVCCLTDYSFHVSPIEWSPSLPDEITECIQKEGITSFKVYMAYKESIGLEDEDLKRVMKSVAQAGGIVTIHCEAGDEIEMLRNRFFKEGKRSPRFHPLSRPANFETQAVKKAIEFAKDTDCPLYIVHVSSALSLKEIHRARQNRQKVCAETCPHYLLLDDSKYEGTFEQTAPFVLSPPLRKKKDNEALWDALSDEIVQTIGTDHCPFTKKQKRKGLHDFRKIANGAGGVEHRMRLIYTYGVLQNKISLNRFVALTSTNAAKIFGLYPQKGVLAEGADADVVVWNPKVKNILSAKTHHMHCDTDIFEGFPVSGEAEYVIVHGNIVLRNRTWNQEKPLGRFLKR